MSAGISPGIDIERDRKMVLYQCAKCGGFFRWEEIQPIVHMTRHYLCKECFKKNRAQNPSGDFEIHEIDRWRI